MEGQAVFLAGGRRDTIEVVSKDPPGLAKAWQDRGATRLHVIDLDAAMGEGENRATVRSILRSARIPIQVGGGLRDEESLHDILGYKTASALIGTRAVQDRSWLKEMAAQFPSRLILALDRDERGVLVDGWRRAVTTNPRDLIDLTNRLPIGGVLFTNVAVEGQLRGVGDPKDNLVGRCVHETIAAGGVTTTKDIQLLQLVGYDSVVVGRALYGGTLDFRQAEEAMR